MPHLLVPELRAALRDDRRPAGCVVAQPRAAGGGDRRASRRETHLEVLARHAPDLTLDVVLADAAAVARPRRRSTTAAAALGADVVLAPLARDGYPDRHDPDRLAAAFRRPVRTRPTPE